MKKLNQWPQHILLGNENTYSFFGFSIYTFSSIDLLAGMEVLYPLKSKISLDDYVPAEKSHSRLQNMILSSYPVLCDVVRISEKKKKQEWKMYLRASFYILLEIVNRFSFGDCLFL